MYKKIVCASLLCLTMVSCGSPDGTSEDTDGLGLANHRIFVTSTTHSGNLKGTEDSAVVGADKICDERKRAAGLTREYKAIISVPGQQASSRLNITGEIYIFTGAETKLLVAANEADLWAADDDPLLNAINIDEAYNSVAGQKVWTGTNLNGGLANDHCNGFTSTTGSAWYGLASSKDGQWTESDTDPCTNSYRIYCISQ